MIVTEPGARSYHRKLSADAHLLGPLFDGRVRSGNVTTSSSICSNTAGASPGNGLRSRDQRTVALNTDSIGRDALPREPPQDVQWYHPLPRL
jgi:hypothetical protein